MTRIVLDDFAGHAFTLDLAEGLAELGHDVRYAYCRSNLTPHADFDTASVPVTAITSGRRFEKYGVVRRLLAEARYGLGSAAHVFRSRPDAVVANNMPLGSLAFVWIAARIVRARYVVWLQDVTSGLVAGVLGDRSAVARATSVAERFLLRRADRVIAISDALADQARAFGVEPEQIAVLANWPALRHLPIVARDNPWAARHGLGARPVVMYSGTLARKHQPDHLVELARRIPDADVVVVTEGEGGARVRERIRDEGIDNLRVLPYQPARDLPEVLGAADVLVVLLNETASRYSVPSKVLSYLCAGRAIVAAVPADNDAAQLVDGIAGAGIVVTPSDPDAFVTAVESLLASPDRRAELGARGRAFAEREFGREAVVDRFLERSGIDPVPVAREDPSERDAPDIMDRCRRDGV